MELHGNFYNVCSIIFCWLILDEAEAKEKSAENADTVSFDEIGGKSDYIYAFFWEIRTNSVTVEIYLFPPIVFLDSWVEAKPKSKKKKARRDN